MARANRIEIRLLHERDVFEHRFHVDVTSVKRMRVVNVGALKEDTLAVDGKVMIVASIHDADVAETVFSGENSLFLAGLIALRNNDAVEVRPVRAPSGETRKFRRRKRNGRFAVPLNGDGLFVFRDRGAVGVDEFHAQRLNGIGALPVVEDNGGAETARRRVRALVGDGKVMVANKGLRFRDKIDVAVNSAQAPHILPFEIRSVAPAVHADGKLVLARLDRGGNIEFRVRIGTLRVSAECSVDPYGAAAVNAVKMDENFFVRPRFRQIERTAVEARRVVIDNSVFFVAFHCAGWMIVERVTGVVVGRKIVLARHLPVHRNADIVPIGIVEIGGLKFAGAGPLFRSLNPAEFPRPVEIHYQIAVSIEPRSVVAFV